MAKRVSNGFSALYMKVVLVQDLILWSLIRYLFAILFKGLHWLPHPSLIGSARNIKTKITIHYHLSLIGKCTESIKIISIGRYISAGYSLIKIIVWPPPEAIEIRLGTSKIIR